MLTRMTRLEADEWSERVGRWRASGLSAAKFARGQDFKPSALYWWASKLKREGVTPEEQKSRPRLAQVVRTPVSGTAGSGLVLRAGDVEVLVASDTDRGLLRDVLGALREGAR